MEWDSDQRAVRLTSIPGLLLRGTRSSRDLSKFAFRLPHRQRVTHSPSRLPLRSERRHQGTRESSILRPTERRGETHLLCPGTKEVPSALDSSGCLDGDTKKVSSS